MKWASPYYFQLFFALGIIIILLFLFQKRKERIQSQIIEESVLKSISYGASKQMVVLKGILLILALSLSIVALARPQWGFKWQEIKRQGIDVLLAIDVSRSMLTEDVKPNRLARTKLAVQDLVKRLNGDRVGLIAFAGDAFLVCPLTNDYDGFLLSLNDLNINTIPRGGTNVSSAIVEAQKGFDDVNNKFKSIVIVTDGDNLEGDPVKFAKKAKEDGIRIYTVGVGTQQGELISLRRPNGKQDFLKDKKGNFVKSRLNESLLKNIALTADGAYVKSRGAQFGLDLIYDNELSKLEKREIESKMEKQYYERFQVPLALAFIFLLVETCLFLRKE